MKNLLLITLLLCSTFIAKADEYVITAIPVEIEPGVDVDSEDCGTLEIKLKSSKLITALKFDLYIPDVLAFNPDYNYEGELLPYTVVKKEKKYNHRIDVQKYLDQDQDKDNYTRYLINIYATDESELTDTEGTLMTFDLGSRSDATAGIYNVYVTSQYLTVSREEEYKNSLSASYVIYGNPSDRTFHAEGPLASIFTSEILEGTTIDLSNAESIAGSCSNNINVTYSRSVSNAWNTICLPYDVTSTPAVQYYEITKVCDDKLEVSPIANLAAGTPALAKVNGGVLSAPAENVTINSTLNNSSSMFGTFSPIKVEDPEAYYISQNKFWLNNEYFNVSAFKAYFKNVSHLAKSNSLVIDESHPTAINNAEINLNAAEEVYGINGARQSSVQKGMNVVKIGNKVMKVVVK